MLTLKNKQATLDCRKKNLRNKITPSEKRIFQFLKQLKWRFTFQKGLIKGDHYYIVDFFIPRYQLCIEIDGGYHNTAYQQAKDERRDKYILQERKYKLLRIPNAVADTMSIEEFQMLTEGKLILGLRRLNHWWEKEYYKPNQIFL